jgi:hypothetical protein
MQDCFLFVGTHLSFHQVGAVSVLRLDQFLDCLSAPLTRRTFALSWEGVAAHSLESCIPRAECCSSIGKFGDVLRYEFENLGHDDTRLGELLELAEFAQDLESLPAGLSTAVGERGVTLSGGQRLRVGLAQLSYFSDADALLLDDPLAALDAATSEALMAGLICGLWAYKTRVVVTHSPALIACADWLVRPEAGRVVQQGPSGHV